MEIYSIGMHNNWMTLLVLNLTNNLYVQDYYNNYKILHHETNYKNNNCPDNANLLYCL